MTENGERRQGIFYKRLFWSLVGGAVVIMLGAFAIAYGTLNDRLARKVDRSEFNQMVEAVRDIREDIRDIRRWLMPGRVE